MKLQQSTLSERLPSFVKLLERYQALGAGGRADLRRTRNMDAIADLPAYYRWLGGQPPTSGLQRFAFVVPWLRHEGDISLGQALHGAGLSQMRLFQVLRSHPPRDLLQLRRLIQQGARGGQLAVDVERVGQQLWYWGRWHKRRILQDYLIRDMDESNDNRTEGQAQ